jgi:hypothetical protein
VRLDCSRSEGYRLVTRSHPHDRAASDGETELAGMRVIAACLRQNLVTLSHPTASRNAKLRNRRIGRFELRNGDYSL